MRVRGINSYKLAALPQFQFVADSEISALPPLLADTGFLDQFHKRQRTAIQDWEFQVVKFHDRVVNSRANQGGEQMFRGGN